jgi:hypothetical protein
MPVIFMQHSVRSARIQRVRQDGRKQAVTLVSRNGKLIGDAVLWQGRAGRRPWAFRLLVVVITLELAHPGWHYSASYRAAL